MDVEPSDTVGDIKTFLCYKESLFEWDFRLYFGETMLMEDARTLSECNIQEGSVLGLVLRLPKPGTGQLGALVNGLLLESQTGPDELRTVVEESLRSMPAVLRLTIKTKPDPDKMIKVR